ncbi:hypothetical protein L596_024967 [Steinernema carpocapsae]|uniref:poly(ADP-ribose) glycohydrolase n=1 Tax=Steinernema carpocapsae TaxID=34508 RepID=A0A4U5M6E8_STECR|nr:hypothetical protein L596_024967 [Steinernema carpocapsae]
MTCKYLTGLTREYISKCNKQIELKIEATPEEAQRFLNNMHRKPRCIVEEIDITDAANQPCSMERSLLASSERAHLRKLNANKPYFAKRIERPGPSTSKPTIFETLKLKEAPPSHHQALFSKNPELSRLYGGCDEESKRSQSESPPKALWDVLNESKFYDFLYDFLFADYESIGSGETPKPIPTTCEDPTYGWDTSDTIRMPFSTRRTRKDGSSQAEFVKKCLETLTAPQRSIEDVAKTIDLYQRQPIGNFDSLFDLFNKRLSPHLKAYYLNDVIPNIAKLALRLNEVVTKPIPRLRSGFSSSATFSQEQVACLLANAFLCTFPTQAFSPHPKTPFFTFAQMFGRGRKCKVEKLRCFLHYFDCVTKKMPTGLISVRRLCLNRFPDFLSLETQFCDLHVSQSGRIEDTGDKMLEIDFANKFIGGGVLNSGNVQEEIRFTISPELVISMLLCERMSNNEAISIVGSERFCDYTGYGDTFQYRERKEQSEPVSRDKFGRSLCEVVAMDATNYARNVYMQFDSDLILREVGKAFVGFAHLDKLHRPIATGNWGCGVFQGDRELKSLIQLIAASAQHRKELHYFTFGEKDFARNLTVLHRSLQEKKVTTGALLKLLLSYKSSPERRLSVFEFLKQNL